MLSVERRTTIRLIWLFAVVTTVALLAANVLLGSLNQDEGWYLYGARQITSGKLPYRDFAFTQGPVMLFVYALATPLVKILGLAGGRLFTAGLSLISAFCAAGLAARWVRKGRQWSNVAALSAFILIGVNAYHSYFSAVIKTYSLAGLLLVSGFLLLTVALEEKRTVVALLAGVLLGLSAGTRISAFLAIPIVFVWLLLRNKRAVSLALGFGLGAIVTLCLVFVPFLVMAPDSMIFSLVRYHAGREAGGITGAMLTKFGSMSRTVGAYFVACCILVAFVLRGLFARRAKTPGEGALGVDVAVPVWLSLIAIAGLHLSAPFPYDEYQVMLFPLFAAILAAMGMNWLSTKLSERQAGLVVTTLFIICLGSVASSPVIQAWVVRDIDRLWLVKRESPPLRTLNVAAEKIRELAGKDGKMLLTQDPYLAVETGMSLPSGLEMGQFSYFPGMSREDARRRCVLNREMLEELLHDCPAKVAAFSGYGFAVRSPEVTKLPDDERDALFGILEKRYECVTNIPDFGQADTELKIYRLRE